MKKTVIIVVLGFLAPLLGARAPADGDIRKILADRIDAQKQSTGIVVGVIDDEGRRLVAHGDVANDSIFEIGSVTKVFTSLLLADMVQKGEVALTDPVAKYLPPEAKMPERGGKAITLEHLATHTSGLPRMPSNFAPKDPKNPYADYTSTSCTRSCRRTSSRAMPARNTSTRTSARAFSRMCSPFAPEQTWRRSFARASSIRWA
jgi:CubicO group peptidase (beta-lactamase class C family)